MAVSTEFELRREWNQAFIGACILKVTLLRGVYTYLYVTKMETIFWGNINRNCGVAVFQFRICFRVIWYLRSLYKVDLQNGYLDYKIFCLQINGIITRNKDTASERLLGNKYLLGKQYCVGSCAD